MIMCGETTVGKVEGKGCERVASPSGGHRVAGRKIWSRLNKDNYVTISNRY